MQITTYQSNKAWPDKRWLAHMDLGRGCYMSFFGSTEEAALATANKFWERETARQAALEVDVEKRTSNSPMASDLIKPAGRGSHLVGRAWMIRRSPWDKVLVDEAEVAEYLKKGYVKGGARSQP